MITLRIPMKISALLYLCGFPAALLRRGGKLSSPLMIAGLGLDPVDIAIRYYRARLMPPMHLNAVGMPFCTGLIAVAVERDFESPATSPCFRLTAEATLILSAAKILSSMEEGRAEPHKQKDLD